MEIREVADVRGEARVELSEGGERTVSGESSDKSAHRTVEQPHTGEHLARVAALGWPAVETEELGGWLLQASDGFTGRANCVVPTGDPGLALDAALDRVRAFYRRRGLPALIQVVVGSPLEAALCDRGWRARASGKSPHASVDVQVTTLATMLAAAGHAGGRSSVRACRLCRSARLRRAGRLRGACRGGRVRRGRPVRSARRGRADPRGRRAVDAAVRPRSRS